MTAGRNGMSFLHRWMLLGTGAMVILTSSGCFLFGGGGSEDTMAVEEALFRADMAIEEERLDTAVIEFNRAIRADSSQVGVYFELAQLDRQLSEQYREDRDIEAALQENARGLRVLENLMAYRSRNPEDSEGIVDEAGGGDMPMDAPAVDNVPAETDSTPAPSMDDSSSPDEAVAPTTDAEEPGR